MEESRNDGTIVGAKTKISFANNGVVARTNTTIITCTDDGLSVHENIHSVVCTWDGLVVGTDADLRNQILSQGKLRIAALECLAKKCSGSNHNPLKIHPTVHDGQF